MIGTSDAEILIALNPEHHHPTAQYITQPAAGTAARFPGVEFFFQPADIVSQILNFGLPAPVDIQVIGADMRSNYEIAQKIANRLRHDSRHGRRARAADDEPAHAPSGYGPHAHQPGRPDARDVAQSVLVSLERKLPDRAEFLAESARTA